MEKAEKVLQTTLKNGQDKKKAECFCSLHFCIPMREIRHRFVQGKYLKDQTVRNYTKRGEKILLV